MKRNQWVCFAAVFLLSCSGNGDTMSEAGKQEYLRNGDSIVTEVQRLLLENVSRAVQEQGFPGAVEFCSEKAMMLTDVSSQGGGIVVQRLSDRNRNPENALRSPEDSLAWMRMADILKDTLYPVKHFVTGGAGKETYYYKAITISMPTCLKCHGDTERDISRETLLAIGAIYPSDKATGYQAGEWRGIWKVRFGGRE